MCCLDRRGPIMDHYQEEITGNMIAEYQYMLNILVSEMDSKYKLKGMLSLLKFAKEVETDSRYVSLKLSDDDVVISSAYASKFGLSIGDSITLKEKYEDKTYTFTVTQIYPYEASLVVFLSRDHVNYSATELPEHLKSGGIPPFFRVRP